MNLSERENISPYAKRISKYSLLKEKVFKYFFFLNGVITICFIVLIFYFLLKEGYKAFEFIDLTDFLFTERAAPDGTTQKFFEWYPTSEDPRYSLLPLIWGTLATAIPATIFAAILGISIGIYLSEVATNRTREILKPIIELFAGIPTVVLGFFMLVVGATFLQEVFNPLNRLNAILAAVGLSFIIIPITASLTEDALRAIPNEMRIAAYALGLTKWQTIRKVVLPTAISGLSAGVILGFGRAIGETMIVLMASGNAAVITLNLFKSVRTMTATIAAELGEVPYESNHYYALFLIGVVLFVLTFILNLIADLIFNRMRRRVEHKQN